MSNIESSRSSRKSKLNYSSSFKGGGRKSPKDEIFPFNRSSELRHSTGSIKGKRMDQVLPQDRQDKKIPQTSEENVDAVLPSVHNLIKGFQSKIVNGNSKASKSTFKSYQQSDFNIFKTPGYVVESPIIEHTKRSATKRKLSLKNKKSKMTADDARYSILQSFGMSPFAANENRCVEKSFAFFDIQSLFFDVQNAQALKSLYEERTSSYAKKLSGASASHVAKNSGQRRFKSGEFDPQLGRFRSRAESMIDEGDQNENELLLSCPYFRNEVAEKEEKVDVPNKQFSKQGRDITKLISMFNRNRSFENLHSDNYDNKYRHSRARRQLDSSEQDILLEEIKDDSCFFSWDEPNVTGRQIFDFEHIDRGAMYYREYFSTKEHINLFGIDEKIGPLAISIIREVIPKMAVLGHTHEANDKSNNRKYQYRIIVRTCELYTLRVSVLENSIPSTSRHGSSRPLPLKDVLEFCLPNIQLSCLRHCLPGPKVTEQLLKLDGQQLSLTYKIGLLYCKAGQKTEEELYNNEHGGSEFLEFCSVIADTVALKGFQGYRAQLDNKNDSTGQHSLYTTFHGREVMFHVSTQLPFTANDRQQLLRKRHIGNDIVTVVFQAPGSEPFTPQMMRSHFQHVFIIVRVTEPHTNNTQYQIAVSRSRDVPCFGPPIPPNNFTNNSAFREFLLSKLINAEQAAHKSEKFTHMARRTRYEYLKDLANNNVSTQTLETSNKFGFSFSSKKKEKIHPPVSPEVWLQGGLVWTVKFDFEHDGPGSSAFLSISTKAVVFIEQSTQEILLSIPCKTVLGWRPTSHTLKLFYDTGKMAYFTLVDDDLNELPYVVNRLKAVTHGCETQDLSLRRNNDGQLGFHVFYEGLVAEVEPYGLAWQSGLRKGSRLLEISGHVVGSMSHERMILMLKRPGAVRIVVLPPAPDGQPRNYKAVRNLRRYSSMTSVYSMSVATLAGAEDSSSSKEYLTGSTESPNDTELHTNYATKVQSLSTGGHSPQKNRQYSTTSNSDTSSYETPVMSNHHRSKEPPPISPRPRKISYGRSVQERLITSRSASDLAVVNNSSQSSTPKQPQKVLSPTSSVDHEWGELERQITDTRKSIDAKLYQSLANSQSPFFRPSKPSSVVSPEECESNTKPIKLPKSDNEVVQSRTNIKRDRDDVSNGTTANSDRNVTTVFMRRASDFHYPIINERGKLSRESSAVHSDNSDPVVYEKRKPSYSDSAVTYELRRKSSHPDSITDAKNRRSNRNSLEAAMENPRNLSIENEPADYAIVDTPPKEFRERENLSKVPRHLVQSNKPVAMEINTKSGSVALKSSQEKIDSGSDRPRSVSDSSVYDNLSQEILISDLDNVTCSLVNTKVREATEIINERKHVESPEIPRREFSFKHPTHQTPNTGCQSSHAQSLSNAAKKHFLRDGDEVFHVQRSPKLNSRSSALVKAVDTAAKLKITKKSTQQTDIISNQSIQLPRKTHTDSTSTPATPNTNNPSNLGKSPDNLGKLDESLTETFAKIDAAFGFRYNEAPSRDEKRRKRRINKRRSRNFEPPSSDSSEDVDPDPKRRGSRTIKRIDPEVLLLNSLPKSEAEESLEAAISEFHMSLSTMPEKNKATWKATKDAKLSSGDKEHVKEEVGLPFKKFSSHADSTTHNEEVPPRVPVRTSRPQSLMEHRRLIHLQSTGTMSKTTGNNDIPNRRMSDGEILKKETIAVNSVKNLKVRSEVSLTGLRPWSPPLSKPETSLSIRKNVLNNLKFAKPIITDEKLLEKEEINETTVTEVIATEDQLSPLPVLPLSPTRGGIHSLPCRSKKKRIVSNMSYEQPVMSASATCIPLVVRGLDLAANKYSVTGPWSKEDLHVMLSVMETELEQERYEKERLTNELNRSREEKERLLEQSKQAASKLRKFTSLFLDSSPQELENAKKRYSEIR